MTNVDPFALDALFEYEAPPPVSLADRFGVPPFSVLDRRTGPWLARRRLWLSLGIQSELGRPFYESAPGGSPRPIRPARELRPPTDNPELTVDDIPDDPGDVVDGQGSPGLIARPGGSPKGSLLSLGATTNDTVFYYQKREVEALLGRKLSTEEFIRDHYVPPDRTMLGTSVFDPVVAELAVRWWSAQRWRVLDPFAGGSVRGIVSAFLGRPYLGIELRPEQVDANREQMDIVRPGMPRPTWWQGDCAAVLPDLDDESADLILTCHPAGTRITTLRGIVPIEEVTTEDQVITHLGAWRSVSETFKFSYTGPMIEIGREARGVPLRATADHLLLVERDGEQAWRYAKDIRPGDCLVEPLPTAPASPRDGQVVWAYTEPDQTAAKRGRLGARVGPRAVLATPGAARLVGYYVAEGSGRNSPDLAFGPDQDWYIEDVVRLARDVLGTEAIERPQSPTNRVRVIALRGGRAAAEFFRESCGTGAAEKHLPSWVWDCSDAVLAEMVVGAWRGDGTMSRDDGDLAFNTVSATLAEDMRRALLRLGMVASVRLRQRKPTTYTATPLPLWEVTLHGAAAERLAEMIGWDYPEAPAHRRPGRGPRVSETQVLYRVRTVEAYFPEPAALDVYNIEVDDDHSYIAEGIASHNCPPYADLEKYSDDPADLSNMPYPQFQATHSAIIAECERVLRPERFAVWVTSDVRDTKTPGSPYRGLVRDTIDAFEATGMRLYNDLVILDPPASGAVRAARMFVGARKVVRMHQHLLVFVKGNGIEATKQIIAADGEKVGEDAERAILAGA